jgi:hypothetical protein
LIERGSEVLRIRNLVASPYSGCSRNGKPIGKSLEQAVPEKGINELLSRFVRDIADGFLAADSGNRDRRMLSYTQDSPESWRDVKAKPGIHSHFSTD